MTDTGSLQIEPIAEIRTDFREKFGLPRQSGLVPALRGEIIFRPAFSHPDAVRGLERFSHLWLIWGFHAAQKQEGKGWSATVRPPRLGGNTRIGVFATRAPYRPNPLGLSCVRLEQVDASSQPVRLIVSGIDLLDGTPIYDIKPYIPLADCNPMPPKATPPKQGSICWRWIFRQNCSRFSRRKSSRQPSTFCGSIRAPDTRMIRSGSTASAMQAWISGFMSPAVS